MATTSRNSDASLLRLSRYHCFLGQLQGVRSRRPVTSRELAEELGLSEETVRHDLKNVRIEGRPGAGYDAKELYGAIQEYLDLSAGHPFIAMGDPNVLAGPPVQLRDAGVRGVLVLTPVLSPLALAGREVTYFRIPCALKSLARTIAEPEQHSASCCGA